MTLSKSDLLRIQDHAPMRKVVDFGFPVIGVWTLTIDTATSDENGDVYLLWSFSAGSDHVVYGQATFEPMHTVTDQA